MALLRPALVSVAALTVLTGLAYPLAITGIGAVAFPRQAKGSLIVRDGRVMGSNLIGQFTEDPKYFWGRLSATGDYPTNADNSGGSNLAPTNPDLAKAAQARIQALRGLDPGNAAPVPADLVTASGSGLDPHITPAAAEYQIPRVAKARGLPEAKVRELVAQASAGRTLGLLGEPRVNVLKLNLALDGVTP
jgi:K+-transporting ATPase ATPase C chain